MVARQRLRVGRTHAGTIVTIVVDDHHFRVLDGTKELSLHARTSTKPIRNSNAPMSRRQQVAYVLRPHKSRAVSGVKAIHPANR
jgi:hypothetical protein